MRSFLLAAILLTLGIGAAALIAYNAVAGPYSDAALREFDTWYRVIGWAKYAAALLLLWLADRAVLWRERLGWRRALLLWSPLLLFVAWSYLQWGLLGDARVDYLRRHDRPEGGFSGALFFMVIVYPLALVVTAINFFWVQRRQLRLTTTGLRRHA